MWKEDRPTFRLHYSSQVEFRSASVSLLPAPLTQPRSPQQVLPPPANYAAALCSSGKSTLERTAGENRKLSMKPVKKKKKSNKTENKEPILPVSSDLSLCTHMHARTHTHTHTKPNGVSGHYNYRAKVLNVRVTRNGRSAHAQYRPCLGIPVYL